jgi:hypothetical protein
LYKEGKKLKHTRKRNKEKAEYKKINERDEGGKE